MTQVAKPVARSRGQLLALALGIVLALVSCGTVDSSPRAATSTSETDLGVAEVKSGEPAQISQPVVLAVSSQRCDSPTRFSGAAVAIGGDEVLTAAHVVDGELRELLVDERTATVVGLSVEHDLAVLSVAGLDADAPTFVTPAEVAEARIQTSSALTAPVSARRIQLAITTVEGETFQRQSYEFSGAVDEGVSGSALVDRHGRILGVVVLSRPSLGVSYASTVDLSAIVTKLTLAPEPMCT